MGLGQVRGADTIGRRDRRRVGRAQAGRTVQSLEEQERKPNVRHLYRLLERSSRHAATGSWGLL